MKLLNDLYQLTEAKEDLSKLPEDVVKEIQKNIREGASDQEQMWANALELTHKAYEVAGVQRPTPDMKTAWTQYEENLQYAVQQLSKHRGLDSDWRMSSAMFHEAMEKKTTFRVHANGSKGSETYKVHAKTIDDVVEGLKKNNRDLYDVDVKRPSDQSAVVTFSKWGIKKNYRLKIEKNVGAVTP